MSDDRIAGAMSAVAMKPPCRLATTANITLSGLQVIDGSTCAALDRILVKNQTDATENGIFVASASAWERATDFDGNRDVAHGTLVYVHSGNIPRQFYVLDTADPITIDTSTITFSVVSPSAPILFPLQLADTNDVSLGDALIGVKQPFTGAIARTQHDKNTETLSLTEFGVKTSNTGAQNATNLAILLGNFTANTMAINPSLYLPWGQYPLASTTSPANSLSNFRLLGDGKYSSQFLWTGAAGIPVFKFTNARRVGFEDIGIVAAANKPSHLIQFDRAAGQVGSGGPTACFAKGIYLQGGSKGIAFTASLDTNNADGYWEDVDIDLCDIGYAFLHSNSVLHTIVGGSVAEATTAAFSNYMGDGVTAGGHFVAYGVRTGSNATILQLGPTLTRAVNLIGHQSEGDSAIIKTPSSVTSQPLRVALIGGTYKCTVPCTLDFDATTGYLHISGAEITSLLTFTVPTNGPRVFINGGFCQIVTLNYNSYVRMLEDQTLAGAPTYNNLGSGVLRLDHSAGSSVLNTTPIETGNATTLAADGRPADTVMLNNVGATNLDTLTAGYVGQIFTFVSINGNTTIKHTAAATVNKFKLNAAADFVMAANNTLTLRMMQEPVSGNLQWYEIGRKV